MERGTYLRGRGDRDSREQVKSLKRMGVLMGSEKVGEERVQIDRDCRRGELVRDFGDRYTINWKKEERLLFYIENHHLPPHSAATSLSAQAFIC